MKLRPAIATTAIALMLGVSLPSYAVPSSDLGFRSCPEMGWHVTPVTVTNVHVPTGSVYRSGPGGTSTATTSGTVSTSYSLDAGVKLTAEALITELELSLHLGLSTTSSKTDTWSYTQPITPGRYGNLQLGNWSKNISATQYYVDNNCNIQNSSTVQITKIPTTNFGFNYWED